MIRKIKKKVLITGAEGFIAHYLIKKLLSKNFQVYGSYYKKNKITKNSKVKFVFCDVRNKLQVKKVINKIKPNIIFHLAAKSHPFYSFSNPIETVRTNVLGTINILEACKKLNIHSKIVIACSSGQYGSRSLKKLPMVEKDKYEPEHIYGLSKSFQDNLGYQYFKMFKMKIVRAIIFNTSGPGKKHDVFYDICRQFCNQISNKIIKINCGNINNFRDFMHVEDVADALYALSIKGKNGDSYNIGSSKIYKINTIIKILRKHYKKKIVVNINKKLFRKFDEKFISSDNKKILKLGWKPKKNIKNIINDMIEFYK